MINLQSITRTADVSWVTPTRLVMGLLLASPIGGGIDEILAWCIPAISHSVQSGFAISSCAVIRGVEMLCAASFLLGLLMRIFAVPAVVLWALHAVANIGNSTPLKGPLLGLIKLQGDWQFGVVYIDGLCDAAVRCGG
jgi:hypothetical protein